WHWVERRDPCVRLGGNRNLNEPVKVRLGSLADIGKRAEHVRYVPLADIPRLFATMSRRRHFALTDLAQPCRSLFDRLRGLAGSAEIHLSEFGHLGRIGVTRS